MIYTLKILAIAIPYFIGMFLTLKLMFPVTYRLIEKGEEAATTLGRQPGYEDFDIIISSFLIIVCLFAWWLVAAIACVTYGLLYSFKVMGIVLPWILRIILNSMKKCLVILPKIEIRKAK